LHSTGLIQISFNYFKYGLGKIMERIVTTHVKCLSTAQIFISRRNVMMISQVEDRRLSAGVPWSSKKTALTLVPQRLYGAVVGVLSRFTSSANGWTVRTNLHHINTQPLSTSLTHAVHSSNMKHTQLNSCTANLCSHVSHHFQISPTVTGHRGHRSTILPVRKIALE